MAPQQRLELGRRDLEPLVLDQLLQPIDDREVPVPVDAPDISRVQPPGGVERGRRGLRVVQVSRHRSEEHTSELQSQSNLVCRLLLEKKKIIITDSTERDSEAVLTRTARLAA